MKRNRKNVLKKKLKNIMKDSLMVCLCGFTTLFLAGAALVPAIPLFSKAAYIIFSGITFVGTAVCFESCRKSINDYFSSKKNFSIQEKIEEEFQKIRDEDQKIYNEKKKSLEKTKFILGDGSKKEDYLNNKEFSNRKEKTYQKTLKK